MEEIKTMEAPQALSVGAEQVKKLTEVLQKYKTGKKRTEQRIVASENWWKLRNDAEEGGDSLTMAKEGFKSASGWLHNVIVSKHADAMEAYPEPNILPREEDDRAEARILTAIIPCVLEQNQFEKTYSDVAWQKIKSGTGVYKVVWDKGKLNGLGDITISKVNLLNLYWEPGITDIQRSRYFFHTELMDKDLLEEQYPEQLKGKLTGQSFLSTRFLYDDTVSTDGKVTVVECYYHKYVQGRKTVQYVKYVNDQVIFATENDPALAQRGLYDHGMYPYVFDALFPIEGSPCGYGFVDICRNPQTCIDLLNTSFVKNAMAGATPRYFKRQDGGVNEQEFLDLTKSIVNVNGNLGEDSLRQIPFQPLDGVYVNYLDRIIQELRETSGNTETATGSTSSGVTAASAIAALQEASGKGSRDSSLSAYRAYTELVNLSIELIRQFYNMPRKFRIVGQYGMQEYITYTNKNLKPQAQLSMVEGMGDRLPVFDIKVSAQKKNVYTKVSQNELALQFFQMGFFNPQLTDQALMCLDMMEFDGKDGVMQKVSQNGTMFQKLTQYMQLALQLAAKAAPEMVQGLSQDIMQTMGVAPVSGGAVAVPAEKTDAEKEPAIVENARARSNDSAQPDGGAVTGRAKDK
jgi:hypothetical protein